jgi:hypothetical protein
MPDLKPKGQIQFVANMIRPNSTWQQQIKPDDLNHSQLNCSTHNNTNILNGTTVFWRQDKHQLNKNNNRSQWLAPFSLKPLDSKPNNLIAVTPKKPTAADTRRWICPFCNASLIHCWKEALASDNNLPRSVNIPRTKLVSRNQLFNSEFTVWCAIIIRTSSKGYNSEFKYLTCELQLYQKLTWDILPKIWSNT